MNENTLYAIIAVCITAVFLVHGPEACNDTRQDKKYEHELEMAKIIRSDSTIIIGQDTFKLHKI